MKLVQILYTHTATNMQAQEHTRHYVLYKVQLSNKYVCTRYFQSGKVQNPKTD